MVINLQIPTSWNDLSTQQLKKIASYFNKGIQGKTLHLLVFLTLVNTKWYQLKKIKHILIVLKNVPLNDLANHFSYVYEATDLTKFIPKINNLSAPQQRLGNITINEFAAADDAFLKYHHTKNLEYLRVLAAVLYRETSKYNLRTPFIKEELAARVQNFKNVDQNTLLAVMRSYQGCRNYIASKFPKIFPKAKPTKTKPTYKGSQLAKLILELTGDKFGNHQETASTNVYTFLADFQNKLLAQSKIKK